MPQKKRLGFEWIFTFFSVGFCFRSTFLWGQRTGETGDSGQIGLARDLRWMSIRWESRGQRDHDDSELKTEILGRL